MGHLNKVLQKLIINANLNTLRSLQQAFDTIEHVEIESPSATFNPLMSERFEVGDKYTLKRSQRKLKPKPARGGGRP